MPISFRTSIYLTVFCFLLSIAKPNSIHAQEIKPLFETVSIKPIQVVKKAEGHYFLDFGKASFGSITLNSKKPIDQTLTFRFGEKIATPTEVDKKPGGTIRYQEVKVSNIPAKVKYQVPFQPNQRNENGQAVLIPSVYGRVLPFRYVELLNYHGNLKDLNIQQEILQYTFNDAASTFKSSDTVLNQLWDMMKHTIKATSFAGYYVDGDRERIPYEADAYINQLSHYVVDNEYTLARRTNEYFMQHPTWPTEWILHTALLFYNDYQYTGDIAPLKKHYTALKQKTLSTLAREDGLLDTDPKNISRELMSAIGFQDQKQKISDIVDWPMNERDGYELKNINTVVNAFYYRNMVLMAKIANVLGMQEDEQFYLRQGELVKKSINEKLFDSQRGVYIDGEGSTHASIHANLFPLAFGLVPLDKADQVIAFIKSRGMACSVYAAQYLLEGLYLYGEADYALHLMNNQVGDRNWWNMIKQGSTMAWEAWDIKYKPNQDWNHAWGTAPLNVMSRDMWGITPAIPGYAKANIKPQLSDLTQTEIKVPTQHGAIQASFTKKGNMDSYLIRLPKNMEADFIFPSDRYQKIMINGKVAQPQNGMLTLKKGKQNKIEIFRSSR